MTPLLIFRGRCRSAVPGCSLSPPNKALTQCLLLKETAHQCRLGRTATWTLRAWIRNTCILRYTGLDNLHFLEHSSILRWQSIFYHIWKVAMHYERICPPFSVSGKACSILSKACKLIRAKLAGTVWIVH